MLLSFRYLLSSLTFLSVVYSRSISQQMMKTSNIQTSPIIYIQIPTPSYTSYNCYHNNKLKCESRSQSRDLDRILREGGRENNINHDKRRLNVRKDIQPIINEKENIESKKIRGGRIYLDPSSDWRWKKKQQFKRERLSKKFGNKYKMPVSYRSDKVNKNSDLNFIPVGGKVKNVLSAFDDTEEFNESGNEIYRPDIEFLSNARPAFLKWRELEVKRTPIVKRPLPLDVSDLSRRFEGKRMSDVGVHLGYSRKLVSDSPLVVQNSITWVKTPRYKLNGQPNTIYHLQYPVRVSNLLDP